MSARLGSACFHQPINVDYSKQQYSKSTIYAPWIGRCRASLINHEAVTFTSKHERTTQGVGHVARVDFPVKNSCILPEATSLAMLRNVLLAIRKTFDNEKYIMRHVRKYKNRIGFDMNMFMFFIFPVRSVQQYLLLLCSSMFLRIAVCSVFNHRFHLALLHRLVSPARV